MASYWKLLGAAAALAFTAAPAFAAQQIILTPGSVVGSSGDYSAQFAAGNIFDGQTGAVTEPVQANYWLNPDNGPTNAFITIDLGSSQQLTSFQLFNTHNAQYNDRGTGNFSIIGSNDSGFGSFVTLASGTLSPESSANPFLTAQNFNSLNSGSYRYLQFLPTSVSVSGSPCCGTNVYGLNELRVFVAAAPEPGTWALMIGGFGAVGGSLRSARRKRKQLATA